MRANVSTHKQGRAHCRGPHCRGTMPTKHRAQLTSLPVLTQPWMERMKSEFSSLKRIMRVRGSSTCSFVARSSRPVCRAARAPDSRAMRFSDVATLPCADVACALGARGTGPRLIRPATAAKRGCMVRWARSAGATGALGLAARAARGRCAALSTPGRVPAPGAALLAPCDALRMVLDTRFVKSANVHGAGGQAGNCSECTSAAAPYRCWGPRRRSPCT